MLVSTKYKLAFLGNPRCASTSIEKALLPISNVSITGESHLKHINASFYSEKICPVLNELVDFNSMETFCLVRDPMTWIRSWYAYRSKSQFSHPESRNYKKYTGNISFEKFIEGFLAGIDRPAFAKIRSQSSFIRLSNGSIGIDHVFPFEKMSLVENFVSTRVGQPVRFIRCNKSPERDTKLSQKRQGQLREFLEEDINLHEFIMKNS